MGGLAPSLGTPDVLLAFKDNAIELLGVSALELCQVFCSSLNATAWSVQGLYRKLVFSSSTSELSLRGNGNVPDPSCACASMLRRAGDGLYCEGCACIDGYARCGGNRERRL